MYYIDDYSLYCDPFSDEYFETQTETELQELGIKYEVYLDVCYQANEPNVLSWEEFLAYERSLKAKDDFVSDDDLPF